MYFLVVLLPIINSIVLLLFGRFLGKSGATLVTLSLMSFTTLQAYIIFYEVAFLHTKALFTLGNWISVGNFDISWSFYFDSVTSVMLIVITTISLLVHFYSLSYMGSDPHLIRFLAYLSFFTFCMIMMVTSENFLTLFFGWEGVGIASYLLINFWYTRIQANKAALKAVILNRFGDVGLSIGIFSIFYLFKTVSFTTVFSLVHFFTNETFPIFGYNFSYLNFAAFCFFIGTIGKSAQLGLHTWLPDAMEGPTPVSALIHAATMVTAGVFLLIRIAPLLEYATTALFFITIVGALTAFFAGTVGMFQNDLKRVIAYSTCSQLGYMVFSCGLSEYAVSLFHLMNHAFFKALLFLSAGVIIHALFDEQDMRKMGGLIVLLPYTYIMVLIGSLALMGFPFLTGFYSKDLILELSYASIFVEGRFAYCLGVLAAFCTAFYSVRLIYMVFFSETQVNRILVSKIHDAPFILGLPLFILSLCSIFVGFIFRDAFVGLGTDFWNGVFVSKAQGNNILILESEFLPAYIKLIPIIFSLSGALLSLIIYRSSLFLKILNIKDKKTYLDWYRFFSYKWYFDVIYNNYIVQKSLKFGYNVTFKFIDRGALELLGPTGIIRVYSSLSSRFSRLQSGFIHNYLAITFGSIVLLLFLSIYPISYITVLSIILFFIYFIL